MTGEPIGCRVSKGRDFIHNGEVVSQFKYGWKLLEPVVSGNRRELNMYLPTYKFLCRGMTMYQFLRSNYHVVNKAGQVLEHNVVHRNWKTDQRKVTWELVTLFQMNWEKLQFWRVS